MSEPFLGEIRIFGFDFPPRGWAFCDGQILPINQNQSLYSLLGTTYGGDGRTSFALPDLRGRVPIHFGNGHALGQRAGEEQHFLSEVELPAHMHPTQCANASGTSKSPVGNFPAVESNGVIAVYATTSNSTLNSAAVTNQGGNQGHENMQPFLAIRFAIALQGLFPSRN